MASLDVNVTNSSGNGKSAVCRTCGIAYNKLSGYFYKSYAQLYKGNGYLPFCKKCVDTIYENYFNETRDVKLAVKQMCRKFDIYWNDRMYEKSALRTDQRNVLVAYLMEINIYKYSGKSYDDTLREEEALWSSIMDPEDNSSDEDMFELKKDEDAFDVSEEIKNMWGAGYTNAMYHELEQRRQYWIEQLVKDGVDVAPVGTQALLRQIVSMELDINRGRTAGEDVDKRVNTYKNLLSDAMLKPSQQKDNDTDSSMENNPLGVWLYKYENERPLPEDKSENLIRKQVFTWMGHVCKMLGKKNAYTQLYDDEIYRLRVERPEYNDEEDDEEFMMEVMSSTDE